MIASLPKTISLHGRRRAGKARAISPMVWTATAALAVALVTGGCDDDYSVDPEVDGTPTAEECQQGPYPANEGFGVPATLHWVSGQHTIGEESSFFLCQQEAIDGYIQISSPPGVTVTPELAYFRSEPATLEFKVLVERETDGYLGFFVNFDGMQGSVRGLRVEQADSGWMFAKDESQY